MQLSKAAYISLLSVIIALSYFYFSPQNYTLLSSDDAMNILMAYDYHWPENLYCWGQDRGGTLLPLISQLFIALGFKAITAISISNYLIIIPGFLGFSSLLKKRESRLILAVLWFLPFKEFIDLIRYPLGIEYSLIGCIIYLFGKIERDKWATFNNHLISFLLVLLGIAAVWVSDLAVISLSLLLLLLLIYYNLFLGLKTNSWAYFYVFTAFALGGVFIWYAKATASFHPAAFGEINDFGNIKEGLLILFNRFKTTYLFEDGELINGLFAWSLLLLATVLFWNLNSLKLDSNSKFWLYFFIADTLAIGAVILLSSWVLRHHMGRWYFVGIYITSCLIILLIWDNLKGSSLKSKLFTAVLVFVAVICGTSTFIQFNYIYPKTLQSKVSVVSETSSLGQVGIIGNFWNSYILSINNPDQVIATPHDKSDIRNQKLAQKALLQPKILLVKDMWLKNFPDSMVQFGQLLVKTGPSFVNSNCTMAPYKRLGVKEFYSISDLVTPFKSLKHNVLDLQSDCADCRERHVIYGPFLTLPPSKYEVSFLVKKMQDEGNGAIAKLDVSALNGGEILCEKILDASMIDKENYAEITLSFTVSEITSSVEFRMYYFGNVNIAVKGVRVAEIQN